MMRPTTNFAKLIGTAALVCGLLSVAIPAVAEDYDLVILNGRVMDPETHLDAVRNVGIKDVRTAVITKKKIAANETIDAAELVVAPGEMLYFAAGYVRVPEKDIEQKFVNADNQRPDADWLNIRSAPSEPTDAWLKVEYRGSWFYIAADDLRSRASFTLLDAIFASVVGHIPGATPLLTLPVR